METGNEEGSESADRQLQWLLGNNPRNVSSVHGVGQRLWAGGDYLFYQAEFFSNWLDSDRKLLAYDGLVPTIAFRVNPDAHITIKNGDDYWPPVSGYPQGVLQHYRQADYPIHPAPTEYYLPLTANVASAVAAVHEALHELEQW